ncbi:MAG: GAF domain-containing protein, partial [Dehalococcoidia bacterium]
QKVGGFRTLLGVPMLREGFPIGAILIWRDRVQPFTEKQIELVTTFADQAVIAIGNVRLFQELQERTAELARSVEELKALGEVGQAVSSTIDIETVLSTIVGRAVQLSGTDGGVIYEYSEATQEFHLRASHRMEKEVVEELRAAPIRLGEGTAGRAATVRVPVQVPDILDDREYTIRSSSRVRPMMERLGYRSLLSVPLLREQQIMGALSVWRRESGNFEPEVINLLQTFATQSAQLSEWNKTLEHQVEEQVTQIERLGRLKRFFSPQLAELIVAGGAEDPLRTHRQQVTVVFLDLRGFTAFAETTEPEEIMAVLRDYHAEMGKLILEHEGTLERFTGDGMMVFFNDPVPVPNPAERAIRMALAMREKLGDLIVNWRKLGYELDIGVGIGQGYATIGAIGFEGRWDYGAIGTVTNLASRLCGEARAGQILVSQRLFGTVEELIEVEPVGELALKGLQRPVTGYNILRLKR